MFIYDVLFSVPYLMNRFLIKVCSGQWGLNMFKVYCIYLYQNDFEIFNFFSRNKLFPAWLASDKQKKLP